MGETLNPSLTTLRLVLDELNVDPSIVTIDDRKRIQKAVYLAQASGVDLGYRYGWYLKGPYSPRLTRDYFALDDALDDEGQDQPPTRLKTAIVQTLERLRPLFNPPPGLGVNQAGWLEILASILYLSKERGLPPEQVEEVISNQKAPLLGCLDPAKRALAVYDLA